jgi:seryl-tRNA synthetase
MFDKKDVARLIEQLEAERVTLKRRGDELQKEHDRIEDELRTCEQRGKHLADLVEHLSHYHDGTLPEPIAY